MPTNRPLARLLDFPEIREILLDHAVRGIRVQVALRVLLAGFLLLVIVIAPPTNHGATDDVIAGVYAAWALVIAGGWSRGQRYSSRWLWLVRWAWLALFVDLATVGLLTVMASAPDGRSWTGTILLNGLLVVPLLAATQLRPLVCAAIGIPSVAVYLGASIADRHAIGEPWSSVTLRAVAVAGAAVGCVLLTRVQRSRVATIGSLAEDRARLLAETMRIEERERRDLAENLHDGVLQYLLAARQDLEDVRDHSDQQALDRIEQALAESCRLLRSTMTELHPAVLKQAGLRAALDEIGTSIAARSGLVVSVDTSRWDRDPDAAVDITLFGVARELLTNVAKHARGTRADVRLVGGHGQAELTVIDDGRGVDPGALAERLAAGHIGIASHSARLEALGGRLTVTSAQPRGTVARAVLPL